MNTSTKFRTQVMWFKSVEVFLKNSVTNKAWHSSHVIWNSLTSCQKWWYKQSLGFNLCNLKTVDFLSKMMRWKKFAVFKHLIRQLLEKWWDQQSLGLSLPDSNVSAWLLCKSCWLPLKIYEINMSQFTWFSSCLWILANSCKIIHLKT